MANSSQPIQQAPNKKFIVPVWGWIIGVAVLLLLIPWKDLMRNDDMKPGYICDSNPPTIVRNGRSHMSFVVHYLNDGDFIYYIPDESEWYPVYDDNKVILGYVHRTLICPAK